MNLYLALFLINWIATVILVESELFRDVREWLEVREVLGWGWKKLAYLVHCYLCTGTWVGFAIAAYFPQAWVADGMVGFVATGLLIKAGGHGILLVHHTLEKVGRYLDLWQHGRPPSPRFSPTEIMELLK